METQFKQWARALGALVFLILVSVGIQTTVAGTGFDQQDRVVVWVFDVGQGDAIFIDAPDAQILIDGGPGDEILEKLSAVMPFWDRHIDLIINTHPHADHVTGLNYVLERYVVDDVWVSGQEYGTETFAYFEELIEAKEYIIAAGEEIEVGTGANVTVLWPPDTLEGERLDDPNGGSVVLELNVAGHRVLLTGDIGVDEEFELLEDLHDVDVLKVGHQGSKTSSSMAFLTKVDPEISVISVGENDYGHPHRNVLDRITSIGSTILRTDRDGDVRITLDQEGVRVVLFDL